MKMMFLVLLFLVFGALLSADVLAQGCSMCTKTASQLGDKAAKGLNSGILYLAGLPLSIIGALFVYWYRGQKAGK